MAASFVGQQVDQLADLVSRLQAPIVELDVFNGDPLEFFYFITTFEEAVETKIKDERGRLTSLLKYLSDEPKELVSSCVYLSSSACYAEAKSILKDRYGDPYKIMSLYRKQIKDWPKIRGSDSSSFRRFYTFLVKFRCTMRYSGNSLYDSPDLIQLLHSKLPGYVQDRWNRQALKVRKSKGKEAKLNDFMSMLEEEVELVSDPLYSREANNDIREREPPNRLQRKYSKRVFQSSTPITCPLCSLKHDLDDCVGFLKKPVEERSRFEFKSRLCFGCYQPTSAEHTAKTCPQKRTCFVCKGQHPTAMHRYIPRRSPDITASEKVKSSCTKLGPSIVSLCVVHVKIYYKENYVNTYALLDNGSQGSFIKESLSDELKINGIPTTVTIKTLTGETSSQCKLVHGLKISSFDENQPSLKLPSCYTQNEFHVEQEKVPTPNKIKHWKYLDSIKRYLPRDSDDVDIGILIGGNCPLALEPLQVISSKDGGPYGVKKNLGWCIMGPISAGKSKSTSCNKIIVKDVVDQQVASHYFCIQNKVEDQTITEQLTKMYQHDFNEAGDSSIIKSISQEDKKFLELMNKNVIKVNGHYQLPLPFRNPDIKFVDNKSQVIQRANWLKRKLQSNPKMLDDYKEFMSKLFTKGYARPTPVNELNQPEGKGWYIPHFGVYHPKKPRQY